jgi:hypothetical protein
LKLGPFKLGPFNIGGSKEEGSRPFFLFFYVDDDIVCAQGRGGGIALWSKASSKYVLEKGLDI